MRMIKNMLPGRAFGGITMKRIFALLLAMALAMLCAGAMAADLSDLTYVSDGSGITITKCDSAASGELVIPAEIDGMPVKSIGSNAFYNCTGLTDVTIPDGVESIGMQAFLGCDSLTEVTIPSSVTVLGATVFRSCKNLTTVTFAGAQPPDIKGKYLFNYCEKLTTILVPAGSEATYEAALANQMRWFRLEEEQTSVEKRLLDGCKVVGFALPASLPRTGDSSSLALWIGLLSAAGIGAFAMKRRAA